MPLNVLSDNDYLKILAFYKKKTTGSNEDIKERAEKIMATKLCKCIKKLDPINEARSIGICTRSIFNRKGFTRGAFTCKKKQSVVFRRRKRKSQKAQ